MFFKLNKIQLSGVCVGQNVISYRNTERWNFMLYNIATNGTLRKNEKTVFRWGKESLRKTHINVFVATYNVYLESLCLQIKCKSMLISPDQQILPPPRIKNQKAFQPKITQWLLKPNKKLLQILRRFCDETQNQYLPLFFFQMQM